MDISTSDLAVGWIGIKCAAFHTWNAQTYETNATNRDDWSGLYVALNEDTAKGYAPNMVEHGHGDVYLHNVSLTTSTRLITGLDESFKTGHIDMTAVKTALRTAGIDVGNDQLLIPRLGELGYFFKCYNNEEGDMEVIVPNNMASRLTMSAYKKCSLNLYEITGCTAI